MDKLVFHVWACFGFSCLDWFIRSMIGILKISRRRLDNIEEKNGFRVA